MGNTENKSFASAKAGSGAEGIKKITFHFNVNLAVKCIICALLGFASVFAQMAPFSLALYTALFSYESWIWLLFSGSIGLFAANGAVAWVYVASMIMTGITLALLENKDSIFKRCVVCGLFFCCFKFARVCVGAVTGYDVMAVILELMILVG